MSTAGSTYNFVKLYKMQVEGGRYFLHKHPQAASSWQESCIQKFLQQDGVQRAVGDQCRYGLKAKAGNQEGPARKSTGFLTNSPCIAKRLSLRCPNRFGYHKHDHVQLVDGRAKAAEKYPPQLCKAICQGLIDQMEMDKMGQFIIAEVNADKASTSD